MHVLTLTPFYPIAGDDAFGCFVAEAIPPMEQLGIKCSVAAVRPFHKGKVPTSTVAPPAEWIYYPSLPGGFGLSSAGRFLYARLLPAVRRLHQRQPIDLIHAHAPLPCGHAAMLLKRELKIPFVVTVHGLDAFLIHQVPGLAGRWCKTKARRVYDAASQVICISERVREQVLAGTASAKTVVVYNGADPARFAPSGPSAPTLLSVGNLIPIKAHDLVLRAFAAVQGRFPEVQCLIIGDGPERANLLALADSLGIATKVRFAGRLSRSEVAQAMGMCALFVLPSRYEGLGCVYLEAMASERPVVGCRGQGIEEVIQDGENGRLIDPGDLNGLTDAIAGLLGDANLRCRLGKKGRETILAGLTLEHQAAHLARIFADAVTAAV